MQDQTQQSGSRTIQVEIYADVICPWCYIGKRRLDLAFAQRPEIRPAYVWRAFLLNPTMPSTGMDRTCLLYTSPSPRDRQKSRMPSSA